MARLSKNQIKLHNEAEEILKKDVLTYDEKIFVLENWNEAATNNNAAAGAFFTPFGRFKTSTFDMRYKGNEFEFLTIEIASKFSEEGIFILPQQSTPFKYSGNQHYQEVEPSQKLKKFLTETGHKMTLSVGIDTGLLS